ncbi:MAG: type II toxin-antitoxin system VapC family toxin [Schwartzia sp.]|nr:type II toxin-antitoxin system VapC family toxin [Schwartzia sp. (in: firmicutes)]
MRLYLDTCCYNRPYDDQSQDRIHYESEAVLSILHRSQATDDMILGSDILRWEIGQIPDPHRRFKVLTLYQAAKEIIPYNTGIKKRASELQEQASIRSLDSLHIASAEWSRADIFLTTDDRLIRACRKLQLAVRAMNPVSYLAEVIEHDEREYQ